MHLPAITMTREFGPKQESGSTGERNIWTHRHTVLGMVGIFLYVGLEISLFANAIKFFESQGTAIDDYVRIINQHAHALQRFYPQGIGKNETAALLAFFYPFAMMIGRFAGTVVMKAIKAQHLLTFLGILVWRCWSQACPSTGHVAIWCLILCGLANSIMYPTIFALGIAELGPLTSKGSGVITLGNVGGGIIPPLFGLLADKWNYQHAFLLPIVCYLFVVFYGISGYKPERKAAAA